MDVCGREEDFRRGTAGSGDKSCYRGRGGRRSGNVKVDEAPMKREEAMKGSWSSAVDERRPSLAVDDGVGVAAPTRWRMGWRTEEAGRCAEVVVPTTVYELENGGEGGISNFGMRFCEMGESYELIPHLKFQTSRRLRIGR